MGKNEIKKEIQEAIAKIGSDGYRDGSSVNEGWTYHIIPFDDFQDVQAHKGQCVNEFEKIMEHIAKVRKMDMLIDVGANIGYFSYKFANIFKKVIAIESDDLVSTAAKKLGEYYAIKNVDYFTTHFNKEFLDIFEKIVGQKADVTLMLNVHMWITKHEGVDGAKAIMKQLAKNTRYLFFQTAHAESSAMFQDDHLRDFNDIKEYLEECGFTDVEQINVSMHDNKPRLLIFCKSNEKN